MMEYSVWDVRREKLIGFISVDTWEEAKRALVQRAQAFPGVEMAMCDRGATELPKYCYGKAYFPTGWNKRKMWR